MQRFERPRSGREAARRTIAREQLQRRQMATASGMVLAPSSLRASGGRSILLSDPRRGRVQADRQALSFGSATFGQVPLRIEGGSAYRYG